MGRLIIAMIVSLSVCVSCDLKNKIMPAKTKTVARPAPVAPPPGRFANTVTLAQTKLGSFLEDKPKNLKQDTNLVNLVHQLVEDSLKLMNNKPEIFSSSNAKIQDAAKIWRRSTRTLHNNLPRLAFTSQKNCQDAVTALQNALAPLLAAPNFDQTNFVAQVGNINTAQENLMGACYNYDLLRDAAQDLNKVSDKNINPSEDCQKRMQFLEQLMNDTNLEGRSHFDRSTMDSLSKLSYVAKDIRANCAKK